MSWPYNGNTAYKKGSEQRTCEICKTQYNRRQMKPIPGTTEQRTDGTRVTPWFWYCEADVDKAPKRPPERPCYICEKKWYPTSEMVEVPNPMVQYTRDHNERRSYFLCKQHEQTGKEKLERIRCELEERQESCIVCLVNCKKTELLFLSKELIGSTNNRPTATTRDPLLTPSAGFYCPAHIPRKWLQQALLASSRFNIDAQRTQREWDECDKILRIRQQSVDIRSIYRVAESTSPVKDTLCNEGIVHENEGKSDSATSRRLDLPKPKKIPFIERKKAARKTPADMKRELSSKNIKTMIESMTVKSTSTVPVVACANEVD